jgi:hypothetical protein
LQRKETARIFRAEATPIVGAAFTVRRFAQHQAFALAQLAVKEFLPFHVAAIAFGQAGEVMLD